MTTKNPFPGMNPFMEQRWRDAHTMLIAYLRDALQERLPEDLIAGAEEEVVTIGTGDSTQTFRPDLQGRETLPQYVSGGTAAMSKPTDREIYPIRLRDRLPAVAIPLRPSDADVVLELQPLIDQCHERGRYYRLDYRDVLDPPLPPEEAAWVDSLLRDHGLRGADNS